MSVYSLVRKVFSGSTSWRMKEASLYVFEQLLVDFAANEHQIDAKTTFTIMDYIAFCLSQDNVFLRARGLIMAGTLCKAIADTVTLQESSTIFFLQTLQAARSDVSVIVRASALRALASFCLKFPTTLTKPHQNGIIAAIASFFPMSTTESLSIIAEATQASVALDYSIVTDQECPVVDILLGVAGKTPRDVLVIDIIRDTLTGIVKGCQGKVGLLCQRLMPTLAGAVNVKGEVADTVKVVAIDLLCTILEDAPVPFSPDVIDACLNDVSLLASTSEDHEISQASTQCLETLVTRSSSQVMHWYGFVDSSNQRHNEQGQSGFNVVIGVVEKLLNPVLSDSAAVYVGKLALALLEHVSQFKNLG